MKKIWIGSAVICLSAVLLAGCAETESSTFETVESTEEITTEAPLEFSEESYPRIGCASGTEKLALAIRQSFLPGSSAEVSRLEREEAFELLKAGELDGVIDVLFAIPEEEENACSSVKIAEEPVVFFVSPEIGPQDVSLSDLAKIYRREITDWSELGFGEGKIRIVMPGSEPLLRALTRFFGRTETPSDDQEDLTEEFRGTGWIACTYASVYETVYASLGDAWKVNHASPLEAPKAYPLRTGYGLYVKADAPRDIIRFSESAASRETQSLIGEAGFLPVNGDRTISGSVDPEGTRYKVELTDSYGLDSILFYKRFAESNGIRFAFPQIDGLLDDEVEKTVNVLLFSPVIDAVDQLAQYVTESTELRTEPVLVSAFQNTLSVRTKVSVVRLSEHEAERETLHSRTIRSNFELVTGKILSVLDLFNEDVPANGLFDIDGISAIRESITSGDREFGLKRILESLAEGEDVSFEFDEQGVRIYTDETSDPAEIRYEDRLEDVAVYRKYVTDDPVYDGAYEKDAVLPVLVRRENGRGEVVKKTDHSFIDATFYCNENSDTVRRIADDVMERLRVMTDTISETKENPFLYNAVLTLYEMKNAIFAGKRSPYYVSVQKYIYNFPDAPSFEDAYLKTVDLLRKPESLEIRENLFLPYMSEQGILPEKAWYGFVTWYYDAEGGFLGEM